MFLFVSLSDSIVLAASSKVEVRYCSMRIFYPGHENGVFCEFGLFNLIPITSEIIDFFLIYSYLEQHLLT